jgi:hypothetical protein
MKAVAVPYSDSSSWRKQRESATVNTSFFSISNRPVDYLALVPQKWLDSRDYRPLDDPDRLPAKIPNLKT